MSKGLDQAFPALKCCVPNVPNVPKGTFGQRRISAVHLSLKNTELKTWSGEEFKKCM